MLFFCELSKGGQCTRVGLYWMSEHWLHVIKHSLGFLGLNMPTSGVCLQNQIVTLNLYRVVC